METGAGRHESFIQCEEVIFLVMSIHKIRSHNMLQYHHLIFVVDNLIEVNIS